MDEFQDFSGKSYKRNIDHPDLNLNIENWYVGWPNFLTMSKVFVLGLMQPPPGSLVWWTSWGGPPWATTTTGTPRCTLRITRGSSPLTSPPSQPVLWRLWEVRSNTEPRPPSSTITLSTRVCPVYFGWLMFVSVILSPPGHTDHSEVNLGAPLVSISLGLPAIFLIGGPSLDTVPCPLLLRWQGFWPMVTCYHYVIIMLSRSGDVLVMERQARLCYHAVPRILPREARMVSTDTEEARERSDDQSFIEVRVNTS